MILISYNNILIFIFDFFPIIPGRNSLQLKCIFLLDVDFWKKMFLKIILIQNAAYRD